MKITNHKFQIILIVLISLLVGYFFGVNKVNYEWNNYKPKLQIINKEPPNGVIAIDATPFWTVWEKLQTNYYDKSKLDTQKMLNGAINGMVSSVGDPFTMYLPPVQNNNFKQGLSGQFSGIGAELGTKDKQVIVISPLTGSPAEKGGIRAGDTILKVDGQSISGLSLSQAVEKIRGPKGTAVSLTILHKDETVSKEIKITRDTITVKSVDAWVKPVDCSVKCKTVDATKANPNSSSIAYIRLSQFGDNTNKEWQQVILDLNTKIKATKNVKGLVLDLRNNPGGYLTDATFIAAEFLNQGLSIVSQDDGTPVNKKTLYASRQGSLINIPIVVLINKGSASASEIVAGALRDNNRAKLVGETSFGKGTIQEAEDLGGGAGLHITIAKWLTPKGTWVNGEGLKPDFTVTPNTKDPSEDTQLEKAIEELVK